MLGVIAEMGFPPRSAIAFVDVCAHYIIGWSLTYVAHMQDSEMHRHDEIPMEALPREEFPNVRRVIAEAETDNPFAVEFDLGLDALLRGLLAGPAV